MTGGRRTLLVLGVLGLVATGIWLVAAPGERNATPAAAPAAPAPRPSDSTRPRPAAGPSTTASVPPAAATAVPSSPAASSGPAAEPFVQNYAGRPRAKPLKPLPSPTGTHFVRPNVDGCDRNYGEITQCVPWTFPPGTTDKCAWLTERGFRPLEVVAEDRQRLDPDGNKIACDH